MLQFKIFVTIMVLVIINLFQKYINIFEEKKRKKECDALHDLVPFVQLKNVKKTHGEMLRLH